MWGKQTFYFLFILVEKGKSSQALSGMADFWKLWTQRLFHWDIYQMSKRKSHLLIIFPKVSRRVHQSYWTSFLSFTKRGRRQEKNLCNIYRSLPWEIEDQFVPVLCRDRLSYQEQQERMHFIQEFFFYFIKTNLF